MRSQRHITRRRAIGGVTLAGLTSIAGCTSVFGQSQPRDRDETGDSNPPKTGPIHWHVTLQIQIDGESQPVPADIGIGPEYSDSPFYDDGMQMTSIHTHDDSGTIHWELMDAPREGELTLGAFFEIWGEPFSETCILNSCTDERTLTMLVNGKPNEEYGAYQVSDGDLIVIRND